MIYPVESLIYGLFFMAALFFVLSTVSYVAGFFVPHTAIENNGIASKFQNLYKFHYRIGWLFLVLALAAGITSSYIGYSDDEIAACEVSIK